MAKAQVRVAPQLTVEAAGSIVRKMAAIQDGQKVIGFMAPRYVQRGARRAERAVRHAEGLRPADPWAEGVTRRKRLPRTPQPHTVQSLERGTKLARSMGLPTPFVVRITKDHGARDRASGPTSRSPR
jgi:hypothetical protein